MPNTLQRRWFASLSTRILAVNIIALVTLAGGILYLDSYRDKLIGQRRQQMIDQSLLMARALNELVLHTPPSSPVIDTAVCAHWINRLQTGVSLPRVRLYGPDSALIADTRTPQSAPLVNIPFFIAGTVSWDGVRQRMAKGLDQIVETLGSKPAFDMFRDSDVASPAQFPEIKAALAGHTASVLRRRVDGVIVVSVAVPVTPAQGVRGALLMTGDARDIVSAVRRERFSSFEVFCLSLFLTLLLSSFLSRTIARPLRRLAIAAVRVRQGKRRDVAIPRFLGRHDEIGELSRALSDMTQTLHSRLDAIESFAADVSHELKNPLSSVRSAVDVLKKTTDPKLQQQLLDIVQHDVTRLQRLITDISDASRLDAELSRLQLAPFDLRLMLSTLFDIYRTTSARHDVVFRFEPPAEPMLVQGLEVRLGQVVRNLVDNAISFSPQGGVITCTLRHAVNPPLGQVVRLCIEDDGPGIPSDNCADIFKRFYSERPQGEGFGNHSGLGLAISKQIIEAHGGLIVADNQQDAKGKVLGARFTVDLPVAEPRL